LTALAGRVASSCTRADMRVEGRPRTPGIPVQAAVCLIILLALSMPGLKGPLLEPGIQRPMAGGQFDGGGFGQVLSWVWTDTNTTGRTQNSSDWTFNIVMRSNSGDFGVEVSDKSGGVVAGLSLFAVLSGPAGRHFGCYLAPLADNTHTCRGSSMLEPGIWTAAVVLVRRPVTIGLNAAQCLPQPPGPGSVSDPGESLDMLAYVSMRELDSFNDLLACFEYPFSIIWEHTWTKPRISRTTAMPWKCGEFGPWCPVCKGSTEGLGRWIPIPAETEPDKDNLYPDAAVLADQRHRDPAYRFVYVPFSCRYRMFRPKEAAQCLRQKKPLIIGDSRLQGARHHIFNWLRNAGEPVKIMDMVKLDDRLALAKYLHEDGGGRKEILGALAEGRTLLVNSLLHDIASLEKRNLTVTEAVRYLGPDQCPAGCNGTVDACNCAEKRRPTSTYLDNVGLLASLLSSRPSDSPGRFVWLTIDRRPPSLNQTENPMWGWQTPDITLSLESAAAKILARQLNGHVDLRGMMDSAPPIWYDDPVHFSGKSGRAQLFMHAAVQMMLSEICR